MKTIIQIGTAEGDDEVFSYLQNNGFKNYNVFFIEPNIHSKPLIEKRYKNLKNKKIFSLAIADYDGEIDMFFDSNYETGKAHVSSTKQNILNNKDGKTYSFPEFFGHKKEEIKKIKVPCLTLNTFILKYLPIGEKIEHIFIDAEGCDCDIVYGTNFENLKVNNVTFEYIHAGGLNGGMGKKEFKNAVLNLQKNDFYMEDIEIENYNGGTFTKDWVNKGDYNVTFTHQRAISYSEKDNYVKVKFKQIPKN